MFNIKNRHICENFSTCIWQWISQAYIIITLEWHIKCNFTQIMCYQSGRNKFLVYASKCMGIYVDENCKRVDRERFNLMIRWVFTLFIKKRNKKWVFQSFCEGFAKLVIYVQLNYSKLDLIIRSHSHSQEPNVVIFICMLFIEIFIIRKSDDCMQFKGF